jgi:GNAT superfamily N-acetyltransferase
MAASDRFEHDAVVRATADNLRIDAATAEVLREFEAEDVNSRLLKGPALAEWYADDSTRSYVDCDLWVRPSELAAAAAVLERLGFQRHMDEHGLPLWWLEHGITWFRPSDGVTVDIHRALQGIGVASEIAWDVLSASPEFVTVAGQPVPILPAPGRALLVTLHAAHHGKGFGKALIHLDRALTAVSEEEWREAAGLAHRLDAMDSFAAGLRLTSKGSVLAERLGLPATRSVKAALHASSPPPVALGFEQLASARGLLGRLHVVVRKLFPPPGFVRHWWPTAARNRRMLVVGYLYRPVWLLQRAPRGFRVWREARHQLRRGH